MSLPAPILDDRTFQQIVDEVRKRIPLYCPEWTDHNLSDPGITLIELFAWMTDLLIYRLNRVPELHYIKFMEFLGYQRRAPSAAQTRVTFWLTRRLLAAEDVTNEGQTIEANTEISTTQTETTTPVVFTTLADFPIYAPTLKAVVIIRRENDKEVIRPLTTNEFLPLRDGLGSREMFSSQPQVDEAFCFGFDNPKYDLSYHILTLKLNFETKSGVGVDPNYPPYVWEALTGEDNWQELVRGEDVDARKKLLTGLGEVEKDSTRALNVDGEVILVLPKLAKEILPGTSETLHWVRVRVKRPTAAEEAEGMRPYAESPALRQFVQIACAGASINAFHLSLAKQTFLGESSGEPGQRFVLDGTPVLLPLTAAEVIRVKEKETDVNREEEIWRYTRDFATANEQARLFTLDSLSGEVRFGPAVRQPNGLIQQYGKTPPRGARLYFEQHRYGGGVAGNLGRKALNVLKSSIPYIDRVENRLPATGGVDGQSIDAAQLEVQRMIRTRGLAVTPDDYVARVLEQFPDQVARTQCVPLTNNAKETVLVYILPRIMESAGVNGNGYLTNAQLRVSEAVRQEIDRFLEKIRLLTVPARCENCSYLRVRVVVRVRRKPTADERKLKSLVIQRLNELLHPLTGGLYGQGWPFEATITSALFQQAIEQIFGIAAVETPDFHEVITAAADKGPEQYVDGDLKPLGATIQLARGQMVVAGYHQVTVTV